MIEREGGVTQIALKLHTQDAQMLGESRVAAGGNAAYKPVSEIYMFFALPASGRDYYTAALNKIATRRPFNLLLQIPFKEAPSEYKNVPAANDSFRTSEFPKSIKCNVASAEYTTLYCELARELKGITRLTTGKSVHKMGKRNSQLLQSFLMRLQITPWN